MQTKNRFAVRNSWIVNRFSEGMKSRSMINTWTRRPAKKEGEGTRCLPLKQPLFSWLCCLKWPHLFQVNFRLCIFHIWGKWKLFCVVQCARVIWYLSRHIPCMQFAFRLGLVDIKYLVKICIFKFNMLVTASWGEKRRRQHLWSNFSLWELQSISLSIY